MIWRPHFTYIAAATPEQTQAREAAADEEWRKKVIFHPIQPVVIPQIHESRPIVRPVVRIIRSPTVYSPPRRESTVVRIVRIQPRREEAPMPVVRRVFITTDQTIDKPSREWTRFRYISPVYVNENDNSPPDIYLPPRLVFFPPVHNNRENENNNNTKMRKVEPRPLFNPPINIGHLLESPPKQESAPQIRRLVVVRTVSNEPKEQKQTEVKYVRPLVDDNNTDMPSLVVPRHIYVPPQSENDKKAIIVGWKKLKIPVHASPVVWYTPKKKNETEGENTGSSIQTKPQAGNPSNTLLDRTLSAMQQTEGVSTSPPPSPPQQTNNTSSSNTNPIVGRELSVIEQREGVSTSPPPSPPQQTNNTSSSRQNSQIIANTTTSPGGPIVANAATSNNPVANARFGTGGQTPKQSSSQSSSNPLGAIGSFFSGLANAAENAVGGALSAVNNAIQNAYNSAYGNQTQQEKQQLQNQLNQLQQQGQQELSQISQEKQQVQSQLQQVQQQAQQELNQISQEKEQVQDQLNLAQLQAQQELTQISQEKQQVQSQLQQVQQQAQQELNQISQNEQQLQNALQQMQQYQAQAEQMLQQNPNNPQLQSYLQQLQQTQQQAEQELAQLQQSQLQIQSQLQQAQLQAQQESMQLNQAQQQVQSQLQQAQLQAQQELMQLNQAQQQVQSQLQQVEQQGQQELSKLNQAQQQIQSQLQQAQQQIQQEMQQLNKQGQGGNPLQQFFNDISDVSALVGYYATEGLGGVGEELTHLVQGKGLENFSQAVSQFNAIGGQNIAKAVGDVTEVALPAIVTAVVAPELLPAELIGEASSVGIGEAVSKLTTGKWQSLSQVLQEANEGGVLGVIGGAAGSAAEGALAKLGTYIGGKVGDFLAGAGGKALAGAAVNEALTAPFTKNPEQLLLAGVLGAAGGAAGELVSKVPWLEQSEAVRNAIDTSEAGAKLGNELVNEGIEKGVLTPDEINGKTTTEIGNLLRQKYSTLSNDLIKSLDKDTVENLKEEGIITDDQILNPDKFIKAVKDKVPDDKLQLLKDTTKLVKKYNEGISKLVGGWKVKIGNRTLLYRLKLGDETETGLGSAGKSEIFNDIRSVNDIEKNVAGIYNNLSDVRDTAIGLKATENEADFIQNLYKAAKASKSALSSLKPNDEIELSFRDFTEDQSKALSQTIKDYLENEVGKRNVIIYGSNSVKQYLEDIANRLGGTLDTDSDPEAYLIKKGNQVIWKWRKPGDVDAFIKTDNPNDLQKIAQDLAERMNKALGTNRFEAEGNLVIDKLTGDHIVDLHMENESSDYFNLYANNSTGADLGITRPTPNYADLGVAKVSQIALDKANAVGGLRDISLNDLLEEINAGTKIDNPDYVVYLAKQILSGKDTETIKDVLTYFLGEIKDDNLRDYLTEKFSQEFNIPKSDLVGRPFLTSSPQLRDDIENILNEKYRYLAPASYRFKDAADFLTLLKLAADLKDDDNLRALYEQLREEFEERGIIPKDWQPDQLNLNTLQNALKLLNSMSSAGSLGSMRFFSIPILSIGGSSSSVSSSSISSPPSITSPNSITTSISSPPSITSPSVSIPPITISPPSQPPSITVPSIEYPPSPNEYPPPSISPPPSPSPLPSISPSPSPSPLPSISPSPSISPPSSLSVYIQSESPPSPVFSSSVIQSGKPSMPMGPPPMAPSIMPGGFGGGGNNVQEISGMAGEVIYL